MQPHVRAATSAAVRSASRGESDATIRVVGTGVAIGLVALVMRALAPPPRESRARR